MVLLEHLNLAMIWRWIMSKETLLSFISVYLYIIYIYIYIWHKNIQKSHSTKLVCQQLVFFFITAPPPLRLFNNVDVHMQLNPANLFLKSQLEQCRLGYLHIVINRAFFILFISFTWPGCLLWVNFVTKIVTAAPRELEGMQENPGQESKWKSRQRRQDPLQIHRQIIPNGEFPTTIFLLPIPSVVLSKIWVIRRDHIEDGA